MGWLTRTDPLQIMPFASYGTAEELHVRGRALEDEAIDLAQKGTIPLLINSWKRFESDEIGLAQLSMELPDGQCFSFSTDSNGYFRFHAEVANLDRLADSEGWVPYSVRFNSDTLDRPVRNNNQFSGAMLIPSSAAEYGIITDIDDTILHTGVTSLFKWKVLANTLFKRAESRIPLQGAPELYHRLHQGKSGTAANPVFYVSHSPWNLYRYLEFFLNRNKFPKGPILLRSMASVLWRQKKGSIPHKHGSIIHIFKTYPHLSFVLIGDSAEKDADIYLDLARQYPDRIRAIFLRTVRHPGRMKRVRRLVQLSGNSQVFLVDHSDDLARHARAIDLL
jgi:phosphatidate phosphatase APP1